MATERDVFMYRAYLALQKYVIVKDEIGANSPQLIQPLKVIIQFIQQSYVHFLKQPNIPIYLKRMDSSTIFAIES